ncbi:MAG: TRAP transporter small permease [Deltaproteobacteria bacterium]|nr:TRAP transporter small permease [Deltaproteobacteria bacterium]
MGIVAKRFSAVMHAIMRLSSFGAAIIMIFITLLTVCDVVSRIVYKPIFGVPELTEMSMLFICFFTLGYVAFRNREISIELFNPKLPRRLKLVLEKLRLTLCLLIVGIIAWQSLIQGIHVWEKNETTAGLQMPLFPFYFVITYGATLYCIEMLLRLFSGDEKDSELNDKNPEGNT